MKTSKLGLKERILKYFESRKGVWVASGEIQRLTMANTTHTARSAVRRMQELAEDKKLDHELRKGHSFYRLAVQPKPISAVGLIPPHDKTKCLMCLANTENVKNW